MDISPFTVYYTYRDELFSARIHPCCKEDNVVDYAVWQDEKLDFTITKQPATGKWVIALKNADDDFEDELVQTIGAEIEKKES